MARVETRWRVPDGPAFVIRTESGERLELIYSEGLAQWSVRVLPETDDAVQRKTKILPFPPHAVRPGDSKTTGEEVQN